MPGAFTDQMRRRRASGARPVRTVYTGSIMRRLSGRTPDGTSAVGRKKNGSIKA